MDKLNEKAKFVCEQFTRRIFTLAQGGFTGECYINCYFKDGFIRRSDFGSEGPLKELPLKEKE